jgi:hypothetical protein
VSDFCPDGYLPTPRAVVHAAPRWFRERFASALETVGFDDQKTKPEGETGVAALARALSQPSIPAAFEPILRETASRLRQLLHQGKLTAYYFADDGRHAVSREFWAAAQADGVIETGIYWPFGQPPRWYEQRPSYRLFLKQSELDAQCDEQPARKRLFPAGKKKELVAALRTLDLPNRRLQRQAIRDMPAFREYQITEAVFREAEKQAPRHPGRKLQRD